MKQVLEDISATGAMAFGVVYAKNEEINKMSVDGLEIFNVLRTLNARSLVHHSSAHRT